MNPTFPSHRDELPRLRRIEGQVRGIQKMIEEGRYCVDVLTQLGSVAGAIMSVEERILARHLRSCVAGSLGGGRAGRDHKIDEIIDLLARFRRHAA